VPVQVTPSVVERHGGFRVTITGLSVVDSDYFVYLGPTGTSADSQCYRGAHGWDGDYGAVAITAGAGTFVTPPLPFGGPYAVFVEQLKPKAERNHQSSHVLPGGATETAPGLVTYVHYNFQSAVLNFRELLVPQWRAGKRRIDLEDPQT